MGVIPTTRIASLAPTVIDSFVDTVMNCLRATVGVDAVLAAIPEPPSGATITVTLDVTGDVTGPVTWVFPPAVALELARRLLANPDPPADSARDGATELANILTGHATAVLEAHGFRCELGAPRIHTEAPADGVSVRLTTSKGPIVLTLGA